MSTSHNDAIYIILYYYVNLIDLLTETNTIPLGSHYVFFVEIVNNCLVFWTINLFNN